MSDAVSTAGSIKGGTVASELSPRGKRILDRWMDMGPDATSDLKLSLEFKNANSELIMAVDVTSSNSPLRFLDRCTHS